MAASTSTDAPPPGLEAYSRGRLELEFGAADTEDTIQTVTLDIDAAALLSPFRIAHEHALVQTYFPIWIRANLAGHSSVVGVAAMGYEREDAVTPEVQYVANAFGDYLVRSGDTALTDYGAVLSAQAG